jgi:hypothetical protein
MASFKCFYIVDTLIQERKLQLPGLITLKKEKKRTIARKHGHLRVLLLSASENGRGFGSVFHHQFPKLAQGLGPVPGA